MYKLVFEFLFYFFYQNSNLYIVYCFPKVPFLIIAFGIMFSVFIYQFEQIHSKIFLLLIELRLTGKKMNEFNNTLRYYLKYIDVLIF